MQNVNDGSHQWTIPSGWLGPLALGMVLGLMGLSRPATHLYAAEASLPVKEVTVFKDGHAFVVHESDVATDPQGNVVLDYLPNPVIGTFWAYSAAKEVKLAGIVAAQRQVQVQRTALTMRELLEANVNAEATVTETNGSQYTGVILGFPTRDSAELARTNPAGADEMLPQKSDLVLFKTVSGTKAVPVQRIQDVTFNQALKTQVTNPEFRNLLTLKLNWEKRAAGKTAKVGLMYVQKGIRWIPSYQIDLDDQGNALLKLQAILLNEMTDLENATVHLVIGVPTFYFKDTIDPIALQQAAARLSHYFQSDTGRGRSALASQFSNAIMTQAARMGEYREGPEAGGGDPADLPEGAKNEDLYVFTLNNITLKKGGRMVLPVVEFTLPWQDAFVLDLPFAPPPEAWRSFNSQQQAELSQLLNAPKVMHKVRLGNKSRYPLTTAPALLMKQGKVLAQGLMTYTSPGGNSDVNLTTAVDIQVKKTDDETKRTPNALQHNGNNYMRVDLEGVVRLTNHRQEAVEVQVKRYVLGTVDSASEGGTTRNANVIEDPDYLPAGGDFPRWWSWYNWPYWWHHLNGVGQIGWKVKIEPGKTVELKYGWHYFWR